MIHTANKLKKIRYALVLVGPYFKAWCILVVFNGL